MARPNTPNVCNLCKKISKTQELTSDYFGKMSTKYKSNEVLCKTLKRTVLNHTVNDVQRILVVA